MSLKAKVTINYPQLTPLDRTKVQYSYDKIKAGTIAVLEEVTEEKDVPPAETRQVEFEVEFLSRMKMLKDVPRTGLVGEWLFYEGEGDTVHDTSGQGNHGTIYGNVTWEKLPNGKYYLKFGGTLDDYVLINLATPLPNKPITIECFCRPRPIKFEERVILAVKNPAIPWEYVPFLTDGLLRCYCPDYNKIFMKEGEAVVVPFEQPPWYQLIVQVNEDGDFMAGVDGYVGNWARGKITTSANLTKVSLGRDDYACDVNIMSVRVYNRVLSQNEISTLYELRKKTLGLT